jgi:hypothetical protein
VPPTDRGLLARLDALVALTADQHELALLPDGRLAAAEARVAVRATGLAPPGRPPGRGGAATERDAVELLRAVAEVVGLLRVRGDRLEATSLRHAWTQIDEGLRAGLTKGNENSRIFEPCLTWANTLRRVQCSAFSLVCSLLGAIGFLTGSSYMHARAGALVIGRRWILRHCHGVHIREVLRAVQGYHVVLGPAALLDRTGAAWLPFGNYEHAGQPARPGVGELSRQPQRQPAAARGAL